MLTPTKAEEKQVIACRSVNKLSHYRQFAVSTVAPAERALRQRAGKY